MMPGSEPEARVCHVVSGLTPKQTLHPLVFALDDDLHFPQHTLGLSQRRRVRPNVSLKQEEGSWALYQKRLVFLVTLV
ncbi:hypothetical protein F2P81_015641 [Scophthalmus maximus]|uniref:Uncharacterized protein n=1 Tax=Scophthalmus maximus TaxID=52904 RepID=A0A6A4S798_SCOMX|nr:hypothetical protein F2P81_015641 [Scophthalmus maximus]